MMIYVFLQYKNNNFSKNDDYGGNCSICIIIGIHFGSCNFSNGIGSIIYGIIILIYSNLVKILGLPLYVNLLVSYNMWIKMILDRRF